MGFMYNEKNNNVSGVNIETNLITIFILRGLCANYQENCIYQYLGNFKTVYIFLFMKYEIYLSNNLNDIAGGIFVKFDFY